MADSKKLSDLTALAVSPDTGDEVYIRDVSEAAASESKKITHDDLLFGDNTTPSTQASDDAAAIGTAKDAARADHKHAMPAPGVAKVWVSWEMVGAHSILSSYNMTSVTDGGALGRTDHLFDTDFFGADYAVVTGPHNDGWTGYEIGTQVAGGITTARWIHVVGSTPTREDSEASMACFGDQ